MNDTVIIQVIQDFARDFKGCKDGGLSFIDALSKKIMNTVDEDQMEVFRFFLSEIETDKNGYCQIALHVLEKLKRKDQCVALENLYEQVYAQKSYEWRLQVLRALLHMEYEPQNDIYVPFIKQCLHAHKENDYYSLVVLLCCINPGVGVNLLCDFYLTHMHDDYFSGKYNGSICYLMAWLGKYPSVLISLLEQIYSKNAKAGIHLISLMTDYERTFNEHKDIIQLLINKYNYLSTK